MKHTYWWSSTNYEPFMTHANWFRNGSLLIHLLARMLPQRCSDACRIIVGAAL